MTLTKDELMEGIKGLSVLELSDLVKALEEEFGVSAAAPVSMATVQGVAGTAEAAARGRGADGVQRHSKSVRPHKINVIKAVREVTTLGLKRPRTW